MAVMVAFARAGHERIPTGNGPSLPVFQRCRERQRHERFQIGTDEPRGYVELYSPL